MTYYDTNATFDECLRSYLKRRAYSPGKICHLFLNFTYYLLTGKSYFGRKENRVEGFYRENGDLYHNSCLRVTVNVVLCMWATST